MNKKIVFVIFLCVHATITFAQIKTITFNHSYNNEVLKLDTSNYKNNLGQSIAITKLKYYVGEFTFFKEGNKSVKTKPYFLIDYLVEL